MNMFGKDTVTISLIEFMVFNLIEKYLLFLTYFKKQTKQCTYHILCVGFIPYDIDIIEQQSTVQSINFRSLS